LSPLRRAQSGGSTSRRGPAGDPLGDRSAYRDVPDCSGSPTLRLVAGFHARFGPPPPFSTTLAVCSPPDPVTCFSHSRPWGSASLFPCCAAHPSARRPRGSVLPPVRQPATSDLRCRWPASHGVSPTRGVRCRSQVFRVPAHRAAPKRPAVCRRRSRCRSAWSGSGSPRPPRTASADELPKQPFARQRHRPCHPSTVARIRLVGSGSPRERASSRDPLCPVPSGLFLALSRPPACVLPHPGVGLTGIGSWPGGSPDLRRLMLPKAHGSPEPSAPALEATQPAPTGPAPEGA
jgi:hypothetical protein